MSAGSTSTTAPDAPARLLGMPRSAAILIGLGLLLSALSLFGEGGASRAGFAYLWAFAFLWTVALGSLFFVALHHVTHAVWSVVVRRVAEMFASPMWVVALLFLPVVFFALASESVGLFPWLDQAHVAGDHVLEGKRAYLNLPFFVLRALAFFLIWIGFSRYFVRGSLAQDGGGAGEERTLAMRRVAAPFMLVFALTVTFASFDWVMSLDPHWFSTILGVYVFSGMVLAALAAITLTVVRLRARGTLDRETVTDDHLYSLGGLLFAFTCFWAYIAFSQFMLIWFGNLPEETIWFARRAQDGWLGLSVALVVLRFVVPFFLLLSRRAKMNARSLAIVSVLVLAGQLLDLFWLIMPERHVSGPAFGWRELGPPLLLAGVVILCLTRFLARHRPLAVGDPLLEESRHFHL